MWSIPFCLLDYPVPHTVVSRISSSYHKTRQREEVPNYVSVVCQDPVLSISESPVSTIGPPGGPRAELLWGKGKKSQAIRSLQTPFLLFLNLLWTRLAHLIKTTNTFYVTATSKIWNWTLDVMSPSSDFVYPFLQNISLIRQYEQHTVNLDIRAIRVIYMYKGWQR